MNRILSHFVAALSACFLLTQCAGVGRSGGDLRTKRLVSMGFESVPLDKLAGDKRFSGVFKVNGTPLRFLIDSGANRTDLDDSLANGVNLQRDDSVRIVTRGALGREIHSGRGIGSLQIGPMISRDFAFTIAPSEDRRTSTSSYAGQIGLDALSATGALVDIPKAKLWVPGARSPQVTRQGNLQLGIRQDLGQKVLRLGTAGHLPHLILEGTLNGRSVSWVVDTGAEVSVMAAESFDSFNLPSETGNSRMIDASGDRIPLRHSRLHNMAFGEVNISVFDIAIAPLGTVRQYFRDGNGRPVDGILGMDFLTTGHALLDSGTGVLYMGIPGS